MQHLKREKVIEPLKKELNAIIYKYFTGYNLEEPIHLKSTLDSFRADLIACALNHTGYNKQAAADLLKINRTALVEMVKRLERAGYL